MPHANESGVNGTGGFDQERFAILQQTAHAHNEEWVELMRMINALNARQNNGNDFRQSRLMSLYC